MADLDEAKPRMQPQGWLVGRLDARHHDVLAHAAGARDQSIHQGVADAHPARGAVDIDGMLDGMAIAIPRAKRTERRVAQDIRACSSNDDGIAGLLALL